MKIKLKTRLQAKLHRAPSDTPATREFPYGPVQVAVGTVAIFFASQFLAAIILSVVANWRGLSTNQAADWTNSSVYAQFWLVVLLEASVTGLLVLLLKKRHATLRTLGFVRLKVYDVVYALAGFAVYFPLLLAATELLSIVQPSLNINQKQDLGFSTTTTGWPLLLVFISLVILPPLVEEALFRGFLFEGLRSKLKYIPSALITSLLFALPHLLGGGSGSALLWVAGVDTFILSLVLTYLKEKTGSLWPGIFLHMIKNGLAFATLFVFHVV